MDKHTVSEAMHKLHIM